jgi:hypothetical protein
MSREDGRFAKDQPKRKRNPIGFVHFGKPEEEPRTDQEYREMIQQWEKEDRIAPIALQAP